MEANKYKYLKLISFQFLDNWSVQYLIDSQLNYKKKFKLIKIGTFLNRNKTPINIKDDNFYKRVTIKVRNGGVFLRDVEKGNKIGTKKQFLIKKGQFLLSKIDARNGAFGVVSKEINNAIITGNFWTFDIDYSLINPHFLSFITTTPEFIRFCDNASNGTTNRHYLQENLFLNVKIPIPSLKEQNLIVDAYNAKIKIAKEKEQKAEQLEKDIENYLFEELGIEKLADREVIKGLYFIDFKDLERWDVLAEDIRINSQLKKGKYELVKLGEIYNFPKQSWNKNKWKSDNFNYIELGVIDPISGITEVKGLKITEAPSRATQIVHKNDLIIGTTRPYLKRFAIIPEKYHENICSSGFSIISPSPNYDLTFLKEFLMSYLGLEQLKNRMSGATYPAITTNELKEIKIPFPPLLKQSEIANKINEMKDEISQLKEQAKANREQAIKDFENEIFIK